MKHSKNWFCQKICPAFLWVSPIADPPRYLAHPRCLQIQFSAGKIRLIVLQGLSLHSHMGWNTITHIKSDLFKNINDDNHVYFVHGYYAELDELTIAQSEYILPFSAGLQKDNFYAVQFHPEKSGYVGGQILKNFLEL